MRNFKKAAVLSLAASGLVLGAAGGAVASSSAEGVAAGSPGVLSGNLIQVPVHIPINLCGNTIDIIALLNPAFGNECANIG
ncbi:chaplin [Kitasatospora sp. NPDC058444]|uniref:chaplin n=1 Tax=Kitasatospora sp. NPDC058444 TaxID=3346504 RepID=UPI00365118E7